MSDKIIVLDVPEPHYTLFSSTREELPEVIVVNDALLPFREVEIFPWHLRVRISAEQIGENGLPNPTESATLSEVGDSIEAAILAGRTNRGAQNALLLARSTWNGLRELYFQVHDPETADAALKALIASGQRREWEYRMRHDPTWTEAAYIFRLFPMATGLVLGAVRTPLILGGLKTVMLAAVRRQGLRFSGCRD